MNLAIMTAKYVGTPYKLGGWSREEGFDCLSLMLSIADDRGIEVPEEFEGVTRETYAELWETNKKKAERLLFKFAASLGQEIPPHRAFAGDLLIAKSKADGSLVLAIHAGQSLMLSAFTDTGVDLVGLDHYEIKKAYKWVNRSNC